MPSEIKMAIDSAGTALPLVQRGLVRRRPRAGFTLIELLVVVVIIGLLAGIALPSFVQAQDRARNASVQANVNNVQASLADFASEHNGGFPAPDDCVVTSGTGDGGTGLDGLDAFLPGNHLPVSPWSQTPQAAFIPVDGTLLVTAELLADGSESMSPRGLSLGAGDLVDPPALPTHYGALIYTIDPDSQTYGLYGAGKNNSEAVLVGTSSNNAADGGEAP